MLFNLLLASIRILLWFYFVLFLTIFFTMSVDIGNAKIKLALAIPTGTPITIANNAIEMLPLVTDKTIKDLVK